MESPSKVFVVSKTVPETEIKARCSCKKSKCLKLYCECFAAGRHCGKECGCVCCNNTEEHEDCIKEAKLQIKERNPNAFEQKIIFSSATQSGLILSN